MKAQKVRDLDDNELKHQLGEMEEQLFRLKFQMSMGQMDGLKKVRAMQEGPRPHLHRSCGETGQSEPRRERRNNMAEQARRDIKNEKIGQVVSTKMAKTIVVEVSRRVPHPLYKRIIGKRKKFYAHDEEGTAKMGDVVRIVECRPLEQAEALEAGGSGAPGGAGGRAAGGSGREDLKIEARSQKSGRRNRASARLDMLTSDSCLWQPGAFL